MNYISVPQHKHLVLKVQRLILITHKNNLTQIKNELKNNHTYNITKTKELIHGWIKGIDENLKQIGSW